MWRWRHQPREPEVIPSTAQCTSVRLNSYLAHGRAPWRCSVCVSWCFSFVGVCVFPVSHAHPSPPAHRLPGGEWIECVHTDKPPTPVSRETTRGERTARGDTGVGSRITHTVGVGTRVSGVCAGHAGSRCGWWPKAKERSTDPLLEFINTRDSLFFVHTYFRSRTPISNFFQARK